MTLLLTIPALLPIGSPPRVPAPLAVPPTAASVPVPREIGGPASIDLAPLPTPFTLPGIGPGARSLLPDRLGGMTLDNLPSPVSSYRLPATPSASSEPQVFHATPFGPTDLNLSGNATLLVASDATVLNVTLSGNAFLYVHSSVVRPTLTVLGNIRLSGHAILFVNASNLSIGERYNVEWNIQVMGSAQFVTAYSQVLTNGYQWGAAYEENANVTILSSLVGYPNGWLDSSLVGAPRLTVLNSWYSSDVILFDNAFAPSSANFTAVSSAGFNVWLNFKAGTSANLSLPGLTGWRNWSFPAGAQVSNINYTVNVYNSFVLVFAVMLWQGANLTLVDSSDVALSLNIEFGTVDLTGLAETHYGRFGLYSGQFALTLRNTTMFTWNIYTFSGNTRISNSQVGEIQTFGSTWATVHDSNLTAHGGYYGNQGTSDLSIFDSVIAGQIVAYSGRTQLLNCTVNTTTSNRLLATGSGYLYALDTWLAPVDGYQVLGAGIVDIAWSVHVNVTAGSVPVAGARVALAWASNATAVLAGTTNGSGAWRGAVLGTHQNLVGPFRYAYNGTATLGTSGGGWTTGLVSTPLWYDVPIHPLITATLPLDGATNVSVNLTGIVVTFADPMSEVLTQGHAGVAPTTPTTPLWDASGTSLTLGLSAPLAWATTYQVTVGAGAGTEAGVPLASDFVFSFTTGSQPLAIPALTSTNPANGSLDVPITTGISVTFSIAMNATFTTAAFAIAPSVVGSATVTGSLLGFAPSAVLAHNTTYVVTIAVTARSSGGAALAAPIVFSFRTVANATTPPPPPGGSSSTSTPGVPWASLGVGLVLLLVAAAVVLALLRRRRAPPTAPATSAPSAPVAPPPWSEEPSPSETTNELAR